MIKNLSNITKNYQRYTLVFVAVILVLLASCSVKSSIKSFVGIPVNTEKGTSKGGHSFIGNNLEKCDTIETHETKISQNSSFSINDLLPAAILTAIFLFVLGYTPSEEQSHPSYGNLKIPGTLPIFLQYRKLII